MFRIIKTNGEELGMTEKVNYIKIAPNGCFISASKKDAVGVVFNSTAYGLLGHNEIKDADIVLVKEVDGGIVSSTLEAGIADLDAEVVELAYQNVLYSIGVD